MLVDDSVGKQLKKLVRIKSFATEQWLEKCEKPITQPINNYNLFLLSKPTDENHPIRQKNQITTLKGMAVARSWDENLDAFFVHENQARPIIIIWRKIRSSLTNLFYIALNWQLLQAPNAYAVILDGCCSCALSRIDNKCKVLSTIGFILEQQKLFTSLHKIKLQKAISYTLILLYLEDSVALSTVGSLVTLVLLLFLHEIKESWACQIRLMKACMS